MNVQPKKPTMQGPAEWFTGDVWIDSIVQPLGDSQLNFGAVHFAPSARTAWHSHAGGQTLYVTEGRGLVHQLLSCALNLCSRMTITAVCDQCGYGEWQKLLEIHAHAGTP